MTRFVNWLWPDFNTQSADTFYIGKKKIPMALKKSRNGYTVKLGSGFASYTLETNKQELENLSSFVKNFIDSN